MKLKLLIEGIPKINQRIHYSKNGRKYKPETSLENERNLRASIINQLPYEFTPLNGALRINKLHFAFAPAPSLSKDEKLNIMNGEFIHKSTKPDLSDCLDNIFKAMMGTAFCCETQICEMRDVKKYYSAKPKIEIELEEI